MSGSSLQILLVSKQTISGDSLAAYLRSVHNYTVEIVLYTEESNHLISQVNGAYDVALINLPTYSLQVELDVLHKLKSSQSDLEVIIILRESDKMAGLNVLRGGACRYFCEPFDYEELAIALEYSGQSRRTRKDYQNLLTISQLTANLASFVDIDAMLVSIYEGTKALFGADHISMAIFDSEIDTRISFAEFPALGVIELLRPIYIRVANGQFDEMGQPIVINDVRGDSLLSPIKNALLQLGIQSVLLLPMTNANQPIGVLSLASNVSSRQFSANEISLAQAFISHFAVVFEKILELEKERRRRYLAETMSEILAGLTSTLNLDNVLDLILSGLERVVSFDVASILLANEAGDLVLRATRGLPELQDAVGDVLDIDLYQPDDVPPRLLNYSKVDRHDKYHDLLPLPDPHAYYATTLTQRSETIGYLVVARAAEVKFPNGEQELIRTFASHASVAIENAHLYTAQLEQAWVSTALLQMAETTTRAIELDDVIQSVARLTPMLVGVDKCAVLLAEGEGFVVKAYYGPGAPAQDLTELPGLIPDRWPKLQELVTTRDPVVILNEVSDELLPTSFRSLFSDVVILLPLLAKGDVEGVLAIGQSYGEAPFNAHRIQLLSGIANQAAAALESAMLFNAQQEEAWVSAALLQVAEAVAQPGSLGDMMQEVARLTLMLAGIERVAIFQWDAPDQVFRLNQTAGIDNAVAAAMELHVPASEFDIDPTSGTSRPILELDLSALLAHRLGFERAMLWPLRARGDLLGVMVVNFISITELGRRLSILDGIAHQLSLAIENFRLAEYARQRLVQINELYNELKQAFDELKELDRRKTEFLSTVSHELRTPLTSVQSCIEILLAEVYGPLNDKQRTRLEIAMTSSAEEARLIENLLDLARIQEGKETLRVEQGNLLKVIHDVINIFLYDAAQKDISLTTKLQTNDTIMVRADFGKVKQILTNLLSNALKFTFEGGVITVDAVRFDSYIEIQVKDSGIGIPNNEFSKIFARFYQADSSLTRKVGGTGIGLNIAKVYVEMHEGIMWVESELGKGSTFKFTLPLQAGDME